MTFYFLRHGATRGNLERRYVGATDEPLLPESREALRSLRLPPVARVYASPMLRCVETAGIVWPGVPLAIVPDFRECDFGEFEYKNYEQLKGRPEYRAWLDSFGKIPFPGGESRADFSLRAVRAFDFAAREAETTGGDAAFSVHGGTIMAIFEARARDKRDFYDYQAANGRGFAAIWQNSALNVISSL